MNESLGWLRIRLSIRVGRRRVLFQFPPQHCGWLWALAIGLMLCGYVLGAVPTCMVINKSGLTSPYGEQLISIVYAPLILLCHFVPAFDWFFETEQRFLEWLFGL